VLRAGMEHIVKNHVPMATGDRPVGTLVIVETTVVIVTM